MLMLSTFLTKLPAIAGERTIHARDGCRQLGEAEDKAGVHGGDQGGARSELAGDGCLAAFPRFADSLRKPGVKPVFTLSLCAAHPLALVPLQPPCGQWPHTAAIAARRRNSMSVLDGVSLLLAVGLFIYLLVALLRADRN